MSSDDRLEFQALQELEQALEHLKEGATNWRRRALKAEAERAELGVGTGTVQAREQVLILEADNAEMRQRLDATRARVTELLSRLRFLEEQVAVEERSG